MENIKRYLEVIDFAPTDLDPFQWKCWPNGRFLSYHNADASVDVQAVVDFLTDTLFEVTVVATVAGEDIAYRWLNPDWIAPYSAEAKARDVDVSMALEYLKYADTDSLDDILEKCRAIVHGEPFDPDVVVTLDIEDDIMEKLQELAAEQGITLDELVRNVLMEEVERLKTL